MLGNSSFQLRPEAKYHHDVQNKPFWRGKTGPAHTYTYFAYFALRLEHVGVTTVSTNKFSCTTDKPLDQTCPLICNSDAFGTAAFWDSKASVLNQMCHVAAPRPHSAGGEPSRKRASTCASSDCSTIATCQNIFSSSTIWVWAGCHSGSGHPSCTWAGYASLHAVFLHHMLHHAALMSYVNLV